MQLRNKEYQFALLKITVTDDINMDEISALAKELKHILRKTDMLTRTSSQRMWVMLPNTPKQGGEITAAKISKAQTADSIKLCDTVTMTVFGSEELGKIDDAKMLMAELANRE